MARDLIAYKFLAAGALGRFTGFRWTPDTWVEAESADPCRCGIHACSVWQLPLWLDAELWEIELDGDVLAGERKLVATRGRLTRRVERWGPALARDFGRFCAGRTRRRVGFLPVLSGYVGDVDRFVAQNRIAIAGFAAARAAELRDGPAAYDAERSIQAAWLAERLGLSDAHQAGPAAHRPGPTEGWGSHAAPPAGGRLGRFRRPRG